MTIDRGSIDDDLRQFEATRHDITHDDVDGFEDCLKSAKCEEDIQKYLKDHPQLLCVDMRSGHGEWVIPKQKLGIDYVTDFLTCHGDSGGFRWHMVELERADCRLSNKNGDLSADVNHALGQIRDWRTWLENNLQFARQPKQKGGLGLHEIRPAYPAMIYIGRRKDITDDFNRHRNQLRDNAVYIHTYDSIVDTARRFATTYNPKDGEGGFDGNGGIRFSIPSTESEG